MESKLLRHEPCPRCRNNGQDKRGNNLAVYTDHVYCFACGYTKQAEFIFAKSKIALREKSSTHQSTGEGVPHGPVLPSDFVLSLPDIAYSWLKKYDLTDREMGKHKLGWTDIGLPFKGTQYAPCVILPVFSVNGDLLMYQARYFGNDKKLPKYITKGNPQDILHIIDNGNQSTTITIVEDLISAIKVSRYSPCMPIWGSYLSNQVAVRLSKLYNNLNIWLDYDKTKEAHTLEKRIAFLFQETRIISSLKDPKEISGEEIQWKLH